MTKRESNIFKCLAIMLMLAHHLFMYADQPDFPALVYGPIFSTPERLAAFGQLCKLCVAIFVFISAYGTAMSCKGSAMDDDRALARKSTERLIKLLVSFQFVYILAFALCPLGGKSWFTLYSPSRLENLFFALCDFMGLSYVLQTPSYNSAWWYMSLAIILILILPWLIKFCRKLGSSCILLFLVISMWFNGEFSFLRYFFVIPVGIVAAEYSVFQHATAFYFRHNLPIRLLILSCCVGVMVFMGKLYLNLGPSIYCLCDSVMVISAGIFILLTLSRIPLLSTAAEFIGKYSMDIFLIHTFIFDLWFHDFTYSLRYPVLIFIFLLISSLTVSVVLGCLKKLCRIDILSLKISEKINALILPDSSISAAT